VRLVYFWGALLGFFLLTLSLAWFVADVGVREEELLEGIRCGCGTICFVVFLKEKFVL